MKSIVSNNTVAKKQFRLKFVSIYIGFQTLHIKVVISKRHLADNVYKVYIHFSTKMNRLEVCIS